MSMIMKDIQTSDPKEHTQNIKSGLEEIRDHIRKDNEWKNRTPRHFLKLQLKS